MERKLPPTCNQLQETLFLIISLLLLFEKEKQQQLRIFELFAKRFNRAIRLAFWAHSWKKAIFFSFSEGNRRQTSSFVCVCMCVDSHFHYDYVFFFFSRTTHQQKKVYRLLETKRRENN